VPTPPARTLHVVIPFYDEPTTLEPCVRRVLAAPLPAGWRLEIVLVDDHSPSAGGAAATALHEALTAEGHAVRLFRHASNRGKGAAVRSGFDAILSHSVDPATDLDVALIQDADLEYDPHDYAALLAPLIAGEADAVFGNRWHGAVTRRGAYGFVHRLGNRSLTGLSNLLTGLRVRDMECCYKAIPLGVLRRLRPMLTEDRFGIEPQIAAALARLDCRVGQVDVAYDPRGFGAGKKIRPRDAVAAVHVMLRERFCPPREVGALRG